MDPNQVNNLNQVNEPDQVNEPYQVNDTNQGNNRPTPAPRRGRRRALPHCVIRNRFLAGMPKSKTVDGVEVNYDSYDDDDHEDEEIDESLLLDPEGFLLVDRHDRAIIIPYTKIKFQPQNPATKAINDAIQSKYQCPYKNWSEVKADKAGWNQFWNGFREKVTWHKDKTEEVKEVFNKKAARRLSSLLHDVRKKIEKNPSKEPPLWIGGNSVTNLKEEWAKPEYQEICAKVKQNRNSDQGLPEHQVNDPTMNINIEDYDFSLDDVPMMFVQTLNPTMQTSGSGGRGARNINNNQNFNHGFMANQGLPNQQGNPIQSGRGRTGGRRVILPALTINEGGQGRSTTTRAARNVSRGRGGRGGIGRGKEILVDPEPEENSE
ncbi:hypothetical protein QL285_027191 [Trifolium repens]|nr:hypothetical protein QL285_027191 [Trifolium repens]